MNLTINTQKVGVVTIMVMVLILAVATSPVAAKGISDKAGTTGFSFLKLGVGSKAVAMGGAFTGVADDPTTLYYNPAGSINLQGRQFLAGYHNYVIDIQSGFLALTIPFMTTRRLGFFVDYLNFGSFTETDNSGIPTGNFSGGDILIGANFATPVRAGFSAGINLKFMSEIAAGYSSEAVAVDIGGFYRFKDGLTKAGLAVYNLGGVLSGFSEGSAGEHKDKLPMGIRAGLSHSLRDLPVVVALDGVLPNDNDPYLNAGIELYKFKPLYARLGYSTFGENYKTGSGSDTWGGFAAGFGLDYQNYHFAYAFMPYLDLGSSHRVTVSGGF